MLVFRQLFDPTSSTYTYLLGCSVTREAVLIDPVFEQVRRDAALIGELGLQLKWTLDTHVHADHVTGAWLLKQKLGSSIALSAAAGASGVDRQLGDGDRVEFGRRSLEVRATPGHTNGCVTYVLDDESMAFTGDCIMIRGSGRTDFQQGDPRALYRSVRSRIFSLPETCLLYPAHDYRGLTATSVAEEKKFNPRLGGEVGEGDYVGYMKNLDLPHPKKIDEAVPANLRCGQPGNETAAPPGSMEIPAGRRCASPSAASGRSSRTGWRRTSPRCRCWTCASPPSSPDRWATSAAPPCCPAGRARPARQGTAQGQADRRGVPRRQPLGPRHGDPAEGRLLRHRQPARRHAALARRRPRRRRRLVLAGSAPLQWRSCWRSRSGKN